MAIGHFSLPSERVIRAHKQIISWRGRPLAIRCDDGPENISAKLQNWARDSGIQMELSSQASHNKTPISNDLTGRYATNGYPSIIGPALKRFRTSPLNGCGPKIMIALTWPWAVSPQSSIWPWLHNGSTSRSGGNWGDYPRPTAGTRFSDTLLNGVALRFN
jgi:hypothetical protein